MGDGRPCHHSATVRLGSGGKLHASVLLISIVLSCRYGKYIKLPVASVQAHTKSGRKKPKICVVGCRNQRSAFAPPRLHGPSRKRVYAGRDHLHKPSCQAFSSPPPRYMPWLLSRKRALRPTARRCSLEFTNPRVQ